MKIVVGGDRGARQQRPGQRPQEVVPVRGGQGGEEEHRQAHGVDEEVGVPARLPGEGGEDVPHPRPEGAEEAVRLEGEGGVALPGRPAPVVGLQEGGGRRGDVVGLEGFGYVRALGERVSGGVGLSILCRMFCLKSSIFKQRILFF